MMKKEEEKDEEKGGRGERGRRIKGNQQEKIKNARVVKRRR